MKNNLNKYIAYAKLVGGDIDKVLDLWNSNPEELDRMYKKVRNKVKNQEPIDIDKIFGPPSPLMNPNPSTDTDLTDTERKLVRAILMQIKDEVTSYEESGSFVVRVIITSSLSSHREETEMLFPMPASLDDEGVANAIDSCISELKWYYLLNL